MKYLILLGLLNLTFCPLSQTAAQAAVENKSAYVLCRNQKTVRTIRVETDKSQGNCTTLYTKAGVDKSVGSAKNFNSCVSYLKNVRKNLEGANWSCKDISSSSISNSEGQ